MNSDQLGHLDLLVFAFTGVLAEMSWHERRHALDEGRGLFLIHTLPEGWRSLPLPWKLTNESQEAIDLEVWGLSPDKSDLNQELHLTPRGSAKIEQGISRISFLRALQIPSGIIFVQSAQGRPYPISPHQWGNLWVESDLILLAGSITVGEFRRRARHARIEAPWHELTLPPRGLSLPVRDLHPLMDYLPGNVSEG